MQSCQNIRLARAVLASLCLFLSATGLTIAQVAEQNDAPAVMDAAATCFPVTLGSASNYWEYPMRANYESCRTQSIYLASEIGQAGSITALALNVMIAPTVSLNNWTIRMKHTTLSSYSSAYLELGGWTTVYQGTEPGGTTGWRTFTFSTPFAYDGTSNLMIDFSYRNTASATTPAYCWTYQPGNSRSVVRSYISGDPLTWYGTGGSAARNTNVPQIQLTLCGAAGVPSAPTGLDWDNKTADSITWSWTRTSTNEDGFHGHDSAEATVWSTAAGVTTYEETGLAANTQYTRHVHAFNGVGSSDPSNTISAYTLPVAPNATCNRQAGCPSYALNTTFTFTSMVAFGAGSLDHYHYVWDRNPEYTFDGSEPTIWSGGPIQFIGNQFGFWYLHLATHNGGHEQGGTVHLGPYVVQEPVGYAAGDLDHDCDVDPADLDTFELCGSGPAVAQTLPGCMEARLDADGDVDADDFAIFQRCWSGEGIITDLNCGN